MENSTIKLSLENLDQILHTLQISYQKADNFSKMANLSQDVADTPENRTLVNMAMDSISAYLLEISHIDSFFQYCDLNPNKLTSEQNEKVIACQELCRILKAKSKTVIQWGTQIKMKFANSKVSVGNPEVIDIPTYQHIELETIPEEMVNEYDQIQLAMKQVHQNISFIDPAFIFETAGRRLEVLNGKSLYLETEHEMNVFLDFGIFESRKDGLNIAQRYYKNQFHNTFGLEKVVLSAYNDCRFAILKIIKHLPNHGLLVLDESSNQRFVMMDRGLSRAALSSKRLGILTRYLILPNFIVTTGASTPIDLDSDAGAKLWKAYEKIMHVDKHGKEYYQGVTYIYKTLIHDNITKTVSSNPLPMNYNKLYKMN